jgi:hypothetical protein
MQQSISEKQSPHKPSRVERLAVVRSAHGREAGTYKRAAAFVVTSDGARLVAGTRAQAFGHSRQGRRAA